MSKISIFLVDIAILAVFILLPGIRGYHHWQFHEYLFLVATLLYILYLRHRKEQPGEKELKR